MLLLLFLVFIALPIAELWLLIKIGGEIGLVPTLALLVLDSFVGAALARSQSRAAWVRFNAALTEGRMPGREVYDGAMIILGGALLVTPGFITDVFGIAFLLPPSRAAIRKLLTRLIAKRSPAIRVATFGAAAGRNARAGAQRRRDYDYEGSAREVSDPAPELPPRDRPGDGNRA